MFYAVVVACGLANPELPQSIQDVSRCFAYPITAVYQDQRECTNFLKSYTKEASRVAPEGQRIVKAVCGKF